MQGFVFDMVSSPKFEISITIVIALNMIVNAVEYYNESNEYGNIVSVVNTIFVTLYGLESVLKLIGLRLHFFRNPWNIFDLFINILSIICNFFCFFLFYLYNKYLTNILNRCATQVLHEPGNGAAESTQTNSFVSRKPAIETV